MAQIRTMYTSARIATPSPRQARTVNQATLGKNECGLFSRQAFTMKTVPLVLLLGAVIAVILIPLRAPLARWLGPLLPSDGG